MRVVEGKVDNQCAKTISAAAYGPRLRRGDSVDSFPAQSSAGPVLSSCANQSLCVEACVADSNSKVAWHRAQLKKNREALKALEVARFRGQHDKVGDTQKAMLELERKITESEKCIAEHERQTRRPLGTDFT